MKSIKEKLLPMYLIINLLYILVGSYLFTIDKIKIKLFSRGFIVFLIINVLISIVLFIKKKYKKDKIDILLLLIMIFTFISYLFAYKKDIALYGEWGRYEGLFTICYYMTILFISSFIKKQHKKIIVYSIIILGLVELLYALCQKFDLFNVVTMMHYGDKWITGFITNPNFFGTLMLICLCYTIGIFMDSKYVVEKAFMLLFMYGFTVGILLSNTLSCTVGLIFALLFLIIYSIKKKVYKKLLVVFLIIFVTFSELHITDNTTIVNDLVRTKNETTSIAQGEINDDYGTGRIELWKKTVPVIPKYLVHGVGVDNFAYVLDGKPIVRKRWLYDKAHNELLQILVTEGIFAYITYICLYLLVLKRGIKSSFSDKEVYLFLPILGYLVQAMFNISVIEVAPLFYIGIGLLISRTKVNENS